MIIEMHTDSQKLIQEITHHTDMKLSETDNYDFGNATFCIICKEYFKERYVRCRDHDQ